jgi:hypothetical protein
VDFDTTRKDPTARVRIVYGDGTVRTDKTWKLSQLSPKHQIQQDGAGQSPPRVESK